MRQEKKTQPSLNDPVTCGDIIRLYLLANVSASAKYPHLYKSIDQFGTWDDETKEAFLAEFFPLVALMDERCCEVVERFCQLQWAVVPASVRPAFVDFLISLGVIHIDNLHFVLRAATLQFLPSPAVTDQAQQEEIYQSAHECIRRVMDCNPRSALLLIEICEKNFPHVRHPDIKRFVGYARNMVHLINEHERLATTLCTLLLEKLVALEAISVESGPSSCVKRPKLEDGDAMPLASDTFLGTKLELAIHLNVDFFEDLVATMSELVEQKHLKVSEILHCTKTVCVVLSGEGQALNIDPLRFYTTIYNVLSCLPFQSADALTPQVGLVLDCLEMLLIKRRKLVSLTKVAAFVKRTLLVSLLLPTRHSIALLAMTRAIFVAHSGLCNQVGEDAEKDVVANGVYQPDVISPDSSNSLCTDFVAELKLLSMHPDRVLSSFATNLQHGIPSSGQWRLNAQYTSKDPKDWLAYDGGVADEESPFKPALMKFCKKSKVASLTSKNVCSTLCKYLARR